MAKVATLFFQERECIKKLVEGKSAKDTGMAMGLSHRTVEFYFENIKNKLSCSTKSEILAIVDGLDWLIHSDS